MANEKTIAKRYTADEFSEWPTYDAKTKNAIRKDFNQNRERAMGDIMLDVDRRHDTTKLDRAKLMKAIEREYSRYYNGSKKDRSLTEEDRIARGIMRNEGMLGKIERNSMDPEDVDAVFENANRFHGIKDEKPDAYEKVRELMHQRYDKKPKGGE